LRKPLECQNEVLQISEKSMTTLVTLRASGVTSGALLLAHVLASFFRRGFFRDAAAWGEGLKHIAATLEVMQGAS
jgi:hypothetical protein